MIPFAFFQLFSGPISDLYDRNKTVLAGFIMYGFGSLFGAVSPNITLFLTSRIVQGLGFALISPVSVAILGDITPFKNRGIAMGWFGTAITAGIATGPLVGGFLASIWRWAFVLFFALSLLIGVAFWVIFRKQTYQIKKGSFKEILPQIRFGFSDRNVVLLGLTGFFVFFSYIGIITFLADALAESPFQMDAKTVGIIIASSGFSGIVASPFAGAAVDKYGRKKVAILGTLFTIPALLLLTLSNSFFIFIILFIILGTGNAVIWAALTTLSVELLPAHARGTSSSIFNFARFFGYAMAPILLGQVFEIYGIDPLYLIGGVLVILCIPIISMLKPRIRKRS
jgi:MFS family permease